MSDHPCMGLNCHAVEGFGHSAECILEAAADQDWMDSPVAIAANLFLVLRDQPAIQVLTEADAIADLEGLPRPDFNAP